MGTGYIKVPPEAVAATLCPFPTGQLMENEIALESLEPGLFTTRVAVPA